MATTTSNVELEKRTGELNQLDEHHRSVLDAIEAALPASARLQVATANVDACSPSRRAGIEQDLVALADRRIRMRRDALERSLTYTADATMRRLMDK